MVKKLNRFYLIDGKVFFDLLSTSLEFNRYFRLMYVIKRIIFERFNRAGKIIGVTVMNF